MESNWRANSFYTGWAYSGMTLCARLVQNRTACITNFTRAPGVLVSFIVESPEGSGDWVKNGTIDVQKPPGNFPYGFEVTQELVGA